MKINNLKEVRYTYIHIFFFHFNVYKKILCIVSSRPIRTTLFSFAIWLSLLFVLLLNVISLISFIHWSIHSFSHSFMHSVGRSFTHSFIHVMFATIIVADTIHKVHFIVHSLTRSHIRHTLQQQRPQTATASLTSLYKHDQCIYNVRFFIHIQTHTPLKRWREHINVLRSRFEM